MKRLDQVHLHPKLEVPRLICLGKDYEKSEKNAQQVRIQNCVTPEKFFNIIYVALKDIQVRLSVKWSPGDQNRCHKIEPVDELRILGLGFA
jgi:hypothetical protein